MFIMYILLENLSLVLFSSFFGKTIIVQGYVDFGRFDKFNYFVAGSGQVDFVQVSSFVC